MYQNSFGGKNPPYMTMKNIGQKINIDFKKIKEVGDLGVRRTAVFMGLGLNAAYDKNFNKYELTKIANFQFLPPNANEETLAHYKKNFAFWIITSGLRDLIENFSIFLEEIYNACLLFSSKGKVYPVQHAQSIKDFHHKGLKDKIDILKSEFQIEIDMTESLLSINQCRNCLSHRNGIVSTKDYTTDNSLEISWLGLSTFIEEPSGKKTDISQGIKETLYLPKGGNVNIMPTKKTKTFQKGQHIILSPHDLAEICFFIQQTIDKFVISSSLYAKKLNIPFSK